MVRSRRSVRNVVAGALLLLVATAATAQEVRPAQEITVPVGNSVLLTHAGTLENVTVGNPNVADPVVISPSEIVVNGTGIGTTTIFLIDRSGARTVYTVRVTADAPTLEREIERLFPGEEIQVSAMGNALILEGEVRNPQVARKAMELANTMGEGIIVVDHIRVPDRGQILLKVRFAEVSRSALQKVGTNLLLFEDENVATALGTGDVVRSAEGGELAGERGQQAIAEAFSDVVNFFIFHEPSNIAAFLRALKTQGLIQSLAEPNLLAMPAESASFLAGGEFPFPVLQGAGQAGAVTIQFREFGVRLNFVPDITNSGAIRLRVAPEVSALDFANGLNIGGFTVPALITRKAATTIELRDGQTFAIAGLVDNSITENISKVPVLGDIPILGALFRSKEFRQNRSELLVLVTPQIVRPLDAPPPIPPGEPDSWKWDKQMKDFPPRSQQGSGG